MMKIILALVFNLLILASVQAAVVNNIDAPAARKLLQQNKNTYLLDVRTPQEYFQTRIEGTHLIPIDKFVARIAEVPKDRPVLIYCAVGSRSSQVSEYLARLGYPEIYNLNGGIWAWQLRKFPVLKGAP